MVLSDEGKLGIPAVLAFQMHLVVGPRQDESRTERQRPAKRHLVEASVHLSVQRHQKALGEDGTSQLRRALELVVVNLFRRTECGGSPLGGAVTPMHKR